MSKDWVTVPVTVLEAARAALSELLLTRDPIVYSDALRALDEALAQAPIAQPQAAGWRPIETAPHATVVLIGSEEGWVTAGIKADDGWYEVNVDDTDSFGQRLYPTRWQPLPEPPKEGA